MCSWGAVTWGRAIFGTQICGEAEKTQKESVIDSFPFFLLARVL